MAVPAPLGQDAPRKTNFQSLHHDGRILLLRFADQQMNVFGHDHVADDDESIALADLLQHSQKQVPTARSAKQGLSTITTASDEVKVSSAVVAMQIVPHGHTIARPRLRGGDVGHPPTVIKRRGRAIQREPNSRKPEKSGAPPSLFCATVPQQTRFLSQDRCGPPARHVLRTRRPSRCAFGAGVESLTRKSEAFVFDNQPYPVSLAFSNQPMVIARSGGNNWGTSRLDSSIFIVKL